MQWPMRCLTSESHLGLRAAVAGSASGWVVAAEYDRAVTMFPGLESADRRHWAKKAAAAAPRERDGIILDCIFCSGTSTSSFTACFKRLRISAAAAAALFDPVVARWLRVVNECAVDTLTRAQSQWRHWLATFSGLWGCSSSHTRGQAKVRYVHFDSHLDDNQIILCRLCARRGILR